MSSKQSSPAPLNNRNAVAPAQRPSTAEGVSEQDLAPEPGGFAEWMLRAEGGGNAAAQWGLDQAHVAKRAGSQLASEIAERTPLGVATGALRVALEHAGMHDDDRAQRLRALTADIPGQDVIYEQLARMAAYGNEIPGETLAAWGYEQVERKPIEDKVTGMTAVSFLPRADLCDEERAQLAQVHGRPLRPVLAFRGSKDAIDWADDLSPEHVGAFQFAAHEGDIAQVLAELAGQGGDGRVDTTGHSLGGALAQLAATVGPVGRVVTFQAPGIPASLCAEVGPDVEAHHHRAKGDFVAWAGDAHLDGDVFTHDRAGFDNPADAHITHLLPAVNDLRAGTSGHVALGAGSSEDGKAESDRTRLDWVARGGGPDWSGDGQSGHAERRFADTRQRASEGGRKGIGLGLRAGDHALAAVDATAQAAGQSPLAAGLAPASGTLGAAMLLAQGWRGGRSLLGGSATAMAGNGANHITGGERVAEGLDTRQMGPYVRVWGEVKAAKAGGASQEEIEAMIARAPIDMELKRRMRDQVRMP